MRGDARRRRVGGPVSEPVFARSAKAGEFGGDRSPQAGAPRAADPRRCTTTPGPAGAVIACGRASWRATGAPCATEFPNNLSRKPGIRTRSVHHPPCPGVPPGTFLAVLAGTATWWPPCCLPPSHFATDVPTVRQTFVGRPCFTVYVQETGRRGGWARRLGEWPPSRRARAAMTLLSRQGPRLQPRAPLRGVTAVWAERPPC